ncbi:MAG: ferritin-like domain-containing protein [Candidatus Hydrogenedentes bacterium]|nr:ferritin-like domain-containing protein [Candidatus Hydrogenedentota bacterium]
MPSNGNPPSNPSPTTRYEVVSFPESREAAAERRRAFPYRFPRDQRSLGGHFTVQENARRLLRFFYFERRLAQALGSWTLAIPEFEVKLETGRHIFYHADAAHTLRTRLNEQEQSLKTIDAFRDEAIDRFIDEMLSAADAPELLVGMHQVAGRALSIAYRHHIDLTDSVTDTPTIRAMKRILLDYEPMLEWADAAVAAYIEGGVDESRLTAWRWHLQQLLGSIGGISGVDAPVAPPSHLRTADKPYVRNTAPKRDSRFTTFHHTGDYDVADGQPRFPKEAYESLRLRFIRTQRDEVDAIEAFGTFLWDIRFIDFKAECDLARITWDEARHTEIGHRALLASGYDPYELPNRLTGSTCRGPMEPAFAMAEINLFGEVGVLKTINSLIDKAREENDTVLAHVADFIRSDERTHVKKGQHILRCMTDLGNQELELKTRELFTECLISLGAITTDMDLFTVSREDLEHLVGE